MTRALLRTATALVALTLPLGCQVGQACRAPQASLQRMIEQPRYDAFEASRFFEDGLTMRPPPEGTVPFGTEPRPAVVETGLTANGGYALRVPLEVTRELLATGRERYDVVCATCHGVAGSAETPVARNMPLRPPPTLVAPPVSDYPPGRVYRAVDEGFGFMPSYRVLLPSPEERWAVVAYVLALQRSQRARLVDVPDDERRRLMKEAP